MSDPRTWRRLVLLALGPCLVLLAGTAGAADGMTAPPWGEDGGPKLVFGPEDQGLVQVDYKGQFRATFRDTGSGDVGDAATTNFGFRRNRLALRGAWGERLSLYVQTEFAGTPNVGTLGVTTGDAGNDFQLLDAAVRFRLHDAFNVSAGKLKYNFSRENLEACEEPLTLDRSLLIRVPYVETRDLGVAVWGNLFADRVQYRADAMEGREAVSGQLAPASKPRFSARAHATLLDPENGYGYRGTYLGAKRVLTVGGAFQYEPDVAYTDTVTRLGSNDYKAWTVDGFFEYPFEAVGTVTLSLAYEKADLEDSSLGAHPDSGTEGLFGAKNGWYAKGGYLLPHVPLQVFGRFEKWRFAQLANVPDQMVNWYGAGANYYVWGQSLKLSAEWNRTDFDQEGSFTLNGTTITSKNFSTFVTQLQLVF